MGSTSKCNLGATTAEVIAMLNASKDARELAQSLRTPIDEKLVGAAKSKRYRDEKKQEVPQTTAKTTRRE